MFVDTLNDYYRVYESLTPEDLQAAARKYFTDDRLVVTTLSHEPLPDAIATPPRLAAVSPAAAEVDLKVIRIESPLPQLNLKLLFRAGSAHDPRGKEGLAALAAAMIAEAGSKAQRIDEIRQALFPMAGSFSAQASR